MKVYALTNEEQCPGKFKRRRRKKMLQTNKHFVTAGHTKASTLFRNWKSTVLLSMRKVDPTRMNKQIQKDVLPT